MSAHHSISFVVPCFNEEGNVEATTNAIREAVANGGDYDIILVDDHSQDRTLERMQALASADAHIRVIHNAENLGLGGSYKRGIVASQHHYAIMIPGDDGFPAASIAEILNHAGEADIIIPLVINPGVRTPFRAFASKVFTTLLNWLFWLNVGYYNGAVLHRRALLDTVEITTNGFAYQAEALVKLIAGGASYSHCRVKIQERAAGQSSALSLKNQIAVWKTILRVFVEVGLFRKIRIKPSRRGGARRRTG